MTRLFIRFKSFYVITNFLFIVFLFYPLKTFANVTEHTLNAYDTGAGIYNNNVKEGDSRKFTSIIKTNQNTTQTKVKPSGFYQENGTKWVSKVFKGGVPLNSVSHTVYWNGTGSMSTSPAFQMTSNDTDTSKLLRLELDSDVTLVGSTNEIVSKNIFFKNGKNGDGTTNIGFPTPSSGILPKLTNGYTSPYYNVKVFKVLAPSISTFTATPTLSGKMAEVLPSTEPKVYKLISGNSFTLNWTVANATATTQCALTENSANPKTFEGIGAGTYNFNLNTSNVGSFKYDVSNLTADTMYKVSCSHNGLGTTPQRQVNIAVAPAPSVTKFLVKNADGVTLADGLIPNAEITVDDDQQK